MRLSMPVRLTLIICGTVIIVAVLVISWLSGATLDPGAILEHIGTVIGALIAGLGLAGGPSPRAGAAAVLLLALTAQGCAACRAERAVVSALDAGVAAARAAAEPEPQEDLDTALDIAQAGVAAGEVLVSACETARDDGSWQAWVLEALERARAVAAFFGGAGERSLPTEPPPELERAITMLEQESQ